MRSVIRAMIKGSVGETDMVWVDEWRNFFFSVYLVITQSPISLGLPIRETDSKHGNISHAVNAPTNAYLYPSPWGEAVRAVRAVIDPD